MKDNKCIVDRYVEYEKCNIRNIKMFVKEIFQNSCEDNNVVLKLINKPHKINGAIKLYKGKFYVYINVYAAAHSKNRSVCMKYFYVYGTLMHELEHIKINQNLHKCSDYSNMLATIESYLDIYNTGVGKSLEKVIGIFNKGGAILKYQTMSSELWCNWISMKEAYRLFVNKMTEVEKERIKNILKSLEVLNKNLIIEYRINGEPVNKFINTVKEGSRFIRKNKELASRVDAFCYLFDVNGNIKSLENLYNDSLVENELLYKELMLNYILYIDMNYSEILEKNEVLKIYIEKILNEYCLNCIEYIENQAWAGVFVDQKVLEDNEYMILSNMKYVNNLMETLKLNRYVGGIIVK